MEPINPVRERLRDGRIAIGFGVNHSRLVAIAPLAKACGYHWLFIDMEHGQFDADLAGQMSIAALAAGIPPIVRVPGHEAFHAARALDGGALGIVFPHVDDAATASRCVDLCRFPPEGHRSAPGLYPQLGYVPTPMPEAMARINAMTLVVVMIETPEAVANADEIAAVPGVDVLLIGSADLTTAMGIPAQFEHPQLVDAYSRVIDACRSNGKAAGMGGIYQEALMARYIGLGAHFVLGGSDVAFINAGARARAEFLSRADGR